MRFAESWNDGTVRKQAADAWKANGSLRLEGLLADDVARTIRDALRGQTHEMLAASPPAFSYQYGVLPYTPEEHCDHVLCQFGRWWWSDGTALAAAITGMELRPPEDRILVATLYQRGCFLDPHNDHDGARRCAFVLGLTEDSWSFAEGGHLEFLEAAGGTIHVAERRAPGWNTLDLFDVSGTKHLHQVPVLTRDVERRAFAGWFF